MAKNETSVMGDLTTLATDIEAVFDKHFNGKAALAIAFTLPYDRKMVHWVTNVERADGIALFQATAKKMIAETN